MDRAALENEKNDNDLGDIDPEDLLIEPRILMQDPAYKINHDDKKYPLCIVWEPFNCWT